MQWHGKCLTIIILVKKKNVAGLLCSDLISIVYTVLPLLLISSCHVNSLNVEWGGDVYNRSYKII